MSTALPPGPLPEGLVRDELVIEVQRALDVIPPGSAVVVALSGGPDSTALAYLTVEARPDLVVTLGHIRHGLRDDAPDLAIAEVHARNLGLDLQVAEVVVEADGQGWEAAARAQRYAALRRITRSAGAGWLLIGHTAEDQAETVLMRLARGTGVHGLGGMAPIRGDLVRPLLRIRRNDVRRHVINEGLDTIDDPSNRDPVFRRSTARHEVLPMLGALGPDPVGALARLADLARDDARRLELDAAEIVATTTRVYGQTTAVPWEVVTALDPALARRVVRYLVLAHADGDDAPSSDQVARILSLGPGQVHEVAGVRLTCGGGWLAAGPVDLELPEAVALSCPGRTGWTGARTDIVTTTATSGPTGGSQLTFDMGSPWLPPREAIDVAALPPGSDPEYGQVVLGGLGPAPDLVLRPRADGDRVATGGGTRKLQDVLVDAQVPRLIRDLVPVVATREGRILWVPGITGDHDAIVAGRVDPELHLVATPVRADYLAHHARVTPPAVATPVSTM